MGTKLDISPEELACIQPILDRLPDWVSLEKLLALWDRFVSDVESGYSEASYEYTNDLSARDLIEELLAEAPEQIRTKLLSAVQPVDQRFLEATRPVDQCLAERSEGRKSWWYRVPKHLTGELETDFRSWGIVDQ